MGKILVVDDSGFARRILRQMLEALGHEVSEAASGMAALESYALDAPELVMLDLTMEDVGGLEVLQRLRDINPDVRVIVVSADVQRSTAKLVREAGAIRFVSKPPDREEVAEAVSAALGEVTR